jgi:hypothetical protein
MSATNLKFQLYTSESCLKTWKSFAGQEILSNENRMFNAVFTKARHYTILWPSRIQSPAFTPNYSKTRHNIIANPIYTYVFNVGFLIGFSDQNLYILLLIFAIRVMLHSSHINFPFLLLTTLQIPESTEMFSPYIYAPCQEKVWNTSGWSSRFLPIRHVIRQSLYDESLLIKSNEIDLTFMKTWDYIGDTK